MELGYVGESKSSLELDEGDESNLNMLAEKHRLRRRTLLRLRSDVTMLQCLEIVSALRRLNGVELERSSRKNFSNMDEVKKLHGAIKWRLKVDFLEAWDGFLMESTATATGRASVTIGKSKGLMTGKSEQLLDSLDIYHTR